MIHLDTNILIRATTKGASLGNITRWLSDGEPLALSAVVWSEFLNGPVSQQQVRQARYLVEGRILPFEVREAEKAAELFNLSGRRRVARFDCFIAATAICAGAALATENRKDFTALTPGGLTLV